MHPITSHFIQWAALLTVVPLLSPCTVSESFLLQCRAPPQHGCKCRGCYAEGSMDCFVRGPPHHISFHPIDYTQVLSSTLNYSQSISLTNRSRNPYQPWGICAPQGGAGHTPLILSMKSMCVGQGWPPIYISQGIVETVWTNRLANSLYISLNQNIFTHIKNCMLFFPPP